MIDVRSQWDIDTKRILKEFSLREILGDPTFEGEFTGYDGCQDMLWYRDNLYINVEDYGYSLILGSQQWESQCLNDLEERLAEYLGLEQ